MGRIGGLGDPPCWALTFPPWVVQDTEVLDSTVYRSKASLGRKRRHRAPALRPGATSEGDSWIFQDSTGQIPAAGDGGAGTAGCCGLGRDASRPCCPHRAPSSPRGRVLRRGSSRGAQEPAGASVPVGKRRQGAALPRPQHVCPQGTGPAGPQGRVPAARRGPDPPMEAACGYWGGWGGKRVRRGALGAAGSTPLTAPLTPRPS